MRDGAHLGLIVALDHEWSFCPGISYQVLFVYGCLLCVKPEMKWFLLSSISIRNQKAYAVQNHRIRMAVVSRFANLRFHFLFVISETKFSHERCEIAIRQTTAPTTIRARARKATNANVLAGNFLRCWFCISFCFVAKKKSWICNLVIVLVWVALVRSNVPVASLSRASIW